MNNARTAQVTDYGLAMPQFWQGVRDAGPIMVGIIPFGITCGVMGLTAGLTPLETVMMSLLVFAGAAQFIGITMIGAGITGWGIIVFTTLLVNLRHLLMGASLAPYLVGQPFSLQVLLSFLLTDESYAITVSRIYQAGYNSSYHLGVSLFMYVTWGLSTAAGVFVGSYIPDPLAWGLDFAMPATFLVLLFPRLTDRTSVVVCIIAGVIAVAGALYLPGKWYMIAACVVATIIGGLMDGGGERA
ncbi:AzlC family protein [Thermosinus carboxydivorans Nor1]|uniref:AzlC family protein n=1 Tax=Thermosinus carboxydivorans Nor1 TaxID=401526 RepID=A1HQ98_9FIRM|nr:AzlC family ABC transporter permease [Thermosinus carboxydivorans]EAX47708.1 AzlC family protein [Thermosinus carboxydivorans Nor1]